MFHSKLDVTDVTAIVRSVGYPVLMGIHNKLKLYVTDYSLTEHDSGVARYVMGLSNGTSVLYLTYDKEGKIFTYSVDSPFSPPQDWAYRTASAQSKNPRYIINTLADESRRAGGNIKERIDRLVRSCLTSAFGSLANTIKRDALSKDTNLAGLNTEELYDVVSVAIGKRSKLDVAPTTWSVLESWYDAYHKRIKNREDHKDALSTVFNGEKWLVIAKHGLDSSKLSYFVGAVDTLPMVNAAQQGHSGDKSLSMTIPLQLYSGLNKVPDEYQADLMGALTMFKLYRQRNFPTMTTVDYNGAGIIPYTPLLLDKSSGAVAWSINGATLLMVDR